MSSNASLKIGGVETPITLTEKSYATGLMDFPPLSGYNGKDTVYPREVERLTTTLDVGIELVDPDVPNRYSYYTTFTSILTNERFMIFRDYSSKTIILLPDLKINVEHLSKLPRTNIEFSTIGHSTTDITATAPLSTDTFIKLGGRNDLPNEVVQIVRGTGSTEITTNGIARLNQFVSLGTSSQLFGVDVLHNMSIVEPSLSQLRTVSINTQGTSNILVCF